MELTVLGGVSAAMEGLGLSCVKQAEREALQEGSQERRIEACGGAASCFLCFLRTGTCCSQCWATPAAENHLSVNGLTAQTDLTGGSVANRGPC